LEKVYARYIIKPNGTIVSLVRYKSFKTSSLKRRDALTLWSFKSGFD